VTLSASGGVPVWEFTTSLGTVIAPSTPGLDEALSGLRLGELVVDQANARDLVDRITAMDVKVAGAQTLVRDHASAVAPFGLAASVQSWYRLRDATRAKVDAVAAAAQKAILLQTPQSAPDEGVTALNDLESKAADIDDTAQMVRAQLPVGGPPGTLPASGTASGTAWLGLPWWAWALIGLGSLGLVAVLASASASAMPAVVVAGRA
jgi:hypothetical protein